MYVIWQYRKWRTSIYVSVYIMDEKKRKIINEMNKIRNKDELVAFPPSSPLPPSR